MEQKENIFTLEDFCFQQNDGNLSTCTLVGFSDAGIAKANQHDGGIDLFIPEYDERGLAVTAIGEYAFASTNTPALSSICSWGNVIVIEKCAFARQVMDHIPSDWGNIKEIGDNAFIACDFADLPDKWGLIRVIGEGAFAGCKFIGLPDDFSGIEHIGKAAFFSCKGIARIPESVFNVPYLGKHVFANCSVTRVEDWGDLKAIPEGFLKDNPLSVLPRDWNKVESIGDYAFLRCHIKRVPNDWGLIRSIGISALGCTRIKDLPDDWKNVEHIEEGTFEYAHIRDVPQDWGKVDFVGPRAFSWTMVDPTKFEDTPIFVDKDAFLNAQGGNGRRDAREFFGEL